MSLCLFKTIKQCDLVPQNCYLYYNAYVYDITINIGHMLLIRSSRQIEHLGLKSIFLKRTNTPKKIAAVKQTRCHKNHKNPYSIEPPAFLLICGIKQFANIRCGICFARQEPLLKDSMSVFLLFSCVHLIVL